MFSEETLFCTSNRLGYRDSYCWLPPWCGRDSAFAIMLPNATHRTACTLFAYLAAFHNEWFWVQERYCSSFISAVAKDNDTATQTFICQHNVSYVPINERIQAVDLLSKFEKSLQCWCLLKRAFRKSVKWWHCQPCQRQVQWDHFLNF